MMNALSSQSNRTIWIGRWIMVVAAAHTVFAALIMHDQVLEIARRGVFDAIGKDADVAATAWFVLFGFLLFVLGLTISALERSMAEGHLPVGPGWALLALCALGLFLMPASGFYLALVPAIAILVRGYRHTEDTVHSTPP